MIYIYICYYDTPVKGPWPRTKGSDMHKRGIDHARLGPQKVELQGSFLI
jgi:hypothetical protein